MLQVNDQRRLRVLMVAVASLLAASMAMAESDDSSARHKVEEVSSEVVEELVAQRAALRDDPRRLHELVERLTGAGYRRGVQVEQRGEVAVRGSIVDVFGATAAAPVRIDLWGDEVDRLSEFSVSDQRSGAALEAVEIFGCRELRPTAAVRRRAAALGRHPGAVEGGYGNLGHAVAGVGQANVH